MALERTSLQQFSVMVVDDSVVVRQLLSKLFSADPSVSEVQVAAHGGVALKKLALYPVDVILLDVNMPEMDGIETLQHLQKDYPDIPVIMFSSVSENLTEQTINALSLGAKDFVAKPSQMKSRDVVNQWLQDEVVEKIKGFVKEAKSRDDTEPQEQVHQGDGNKTILLQKQKIDIVVIGVSTGGPKALEQVLPKLPKNFPVPVLLVQHMPAVFTKTFAESINKKSAITIVEAQEGQTIEPGCVYIAPGDYHLKIKVQGAGYAVALNQEEKVNFCRPAVDVLFDSVVEHFNDGVLALVMTGMGSDGAQGAQKVKKAGGQVLLQDKGSSVVWGMPGAVAKLEAHDAVLPLEELADEMCRLVL